MIVHKKRAALLRPFQLTLPGYGVQLGGLKSLQLEVPLNDTVALLLPPAEKTHWPVPAVGGLPSLTKPLAAAEKIAEPELFVVALPGASAMDALLPPLAVQVPVIAVFGTGVPEAVSAVTLIDVVLPALGTLTEFGETCSVAISTTMPTLAC